MDFQYYPTPKALALRAAAKFKNHRITRLLEPSAGRGDLLAPFLESHAHHASLIDVVEANPDFIPELRKRFNLIGTDFLEEPPTYVYSHILMNPPFAHSIDHLSHALRHLVDGELVCIIDTKALSSTSHKGVQLRTTLQSLKAEIEDVGPAFSHAERPTDEPISIVWVERHPDTPTGVDWLSMDHTSPQDLSFSGDELVIPRNRLENVVAAYSQALKYLQEKHIAASKASYYWSCIPEMLKPNFNHYKHTHWSSEEFNKEVTALKQQTWEAIFQSAEFSSRFSTSVVKKMQVEIERLHTLSISLKNIYGVLLGLMSQRGSLNAEMLCEVFDYIGAYHTGNSMYYRGWKSNDKHRVGMKLRSTRFILPFASSYGSLCYQFRQKMRDIDKAFAMLDGKQTPEIWCADVVDPSGKSSVRVQATYFEMRFYAKAGTMHFFPRRPDLVDRLNREVGKIRQWLPETESEAPEEFWREYANPVDIDPKEFWRTELIEKALLEVLGTDELFWNALPQKD